MNQWFTAVCARRSSRVAAGVLALSLVSATAAAALFVSVPGMTGSSAKAGFVGQIEASSLSMNVANSAGRPSLGSIVFTKQIDATTPLLFEASGNGRALGSVVVQTTRTVDGAEIVAAKYTFANARVASWRLTDPGGAVPSEQVTLLATSYTVELFGTDSRGRPLPPVTRTVATQ
jgi:type VI protein secretion system component Hcp